MDGGGVIMGRLARIVNGRAVVAHRYVATPSYKLMVKDYALGAVPPDGWEYYAEDVDTEDFVMPWSQPTGAHDAYNVGAIVLHKEQKWQSMCKSNVWEPGVSGWAIADTAIGRWVQPTGAHDAYAKGDTIKYDNDVWVSLLDDNVWSPANTGWRKAPSLLAAAAPATLSAWKQPAGAHDAYAVGARVIHKSKKWTSTVGNNVWEPGVYGWTAD